MSQTDVSMNDFELPNAAYHPSDPAFETPRINENERPNSVSSVEQLIRVAIALGGQQNGLDYAKKAIEYQKEYEQENVFPEFVVDRDHISESNDVWLSEEMSKYADKRQEIYNEEKKVYDRRMDWYDNDIMDRLQDKMNRALSMLREGIEFKVIHVVKENATGEHEVLAEDLSGIELRKFGYSTPITLTVCVSPDSGNQYAFVPWCGTTVCTGPSKHENPVTTLCKHEVAALVQYAQDQYNPTGPKVPERFKRLQSSEGYNRFMENISP